MLALIDRDLLEPEVLQQEYTCLVHIVESTSVKQYLGIKTPQQVTRKCSTLISSKSAFEKLMKEEARLNNGKGSREARSITQVSQETTFKLNRLTD